MINQGDAMILCDKCSHVSLFHCSVAMNWFTIILIVKLYNPCLTASGWRWDKNRQDFVSILSIPSFDQFYQEIQMKIRSESHKKLNGKVIKLGYYNDDSMVNFNINATEVSGVFGDIWNVLSEYLNFTISPKRFPIRNHNKMIEALHNGESIDVVPRIRCDYKTSMLVDCTLPIWRTSVQLYTQPIRMPDTLWVLKIFQLSTLCFITVVMLMFIVLGIIAEKVFNQTNATKTHLNLPDRIFYSFTSLCSQGWEPTELEQESKILIIIKRFFCWFLLFSLNSTLITYLTRSEIVLPFHNVLTLFAKTDYKLLQYNGSLSYKKFEGYDERTSDWASRKHMYDTVCRSNEHYAVLETRDMKETADVAFCPIVPVGETNTTMWVTGGTVKGSPYLRSFNMGILKMHQSGLIIALRARRRFIPDVKKELTSHDLGLAHVFIVHMMLAAGIFTAMVFFILEHAVFWYQRYRRSKLKRLTNRKQNYI